MTTVTVTNNAEDGSTNWFWRATLLGGLVAGVLDAAESVAALYVVLGYNLIHSLQFVASGVFGQDAYTGGLATAFAGVIFHFFIAFVVAAVYVLAAQRIPALRTRWILFGLAYGAWVWFFMYILVLPLTRVVATPPSVALTLNGIIEHALFVGLPIAYFARKTES